MAPPVKSRPSRYLGVVALALVALYLGVFLGPSATPALGLDLRGGTEVTLTAHPVGHSKVTKAALNQAVAIIRERVNGLGVGGASISTEGSDNIVVQVPGKGHSVVASVGKTALLRFRQVLAWLPATPTTATPTTTPTPTTSASPKATGTATSKPGKPGKHGASSQPSTKASSTPKKSSSPKASASASKTSGSQGQPLSGALLKATAKASSTVSPKPKPKPKPTPSHTASHSASPTATPSPSATATPIPSVSGGLNTGNTPGATVQPLPNSESPTLTAAFEKSFTTWNCNAKGRDNPTQGADNPADYIIACDADPSAPTAVKYLLGRTAVEGTQVSGASAGLDTTSAWVVNLTFNGSGSKAWQKLTKLTYDVNNGAPEVGRTECKLPTGCNASAIVLDGIVQSAPYSQTAGGISGGSTEISGSFTQKSADALANTLKYGSLPLSFSRSNVQSVSATLGKAQLHGGLIAGAIGLGLVIIFSMLYYRALGLVTVGSLAVSGLILYAVTTLLGHSSVGYTLSLPGIAGFIVAVGITADSFVVFFERLRDEIREGRRLRSGVERAWPRARRTIISADFISLLAAFILYVVSIGDVRGFAFTLGLSTLSDLFIVFFFTKPLLTVLARVSAFDSGKTWTGVGKARAGVVRDTLPDPASPRRPRRSNPREA